MLTDALTDPRLWLIVIILSLLGIVTQYALYAAGRRKGDEMLEHVPGMTSERRNRMEARFERFALFCGGGVAFFVRFRYAVKRGFF